MFRPWPRPRAGRAADPRLDRPAHPVRYARESAPSGSKLAFKLHGHQVRYLTVTPKSKDPIATIELVKRPDRTAPLVLAATAESFEMIIHFCRDPILPTREVHR